MEYKKVLQAGEKERIEKEKAIKRMQSMQMEKERERMRRQPAPGSGEEWTSALAGNVASLPLKPVDTEAAYVDYTLGDLSAAGPYSNQMGATDTQEEDISGGASDAGGGKKEGES